MSTVVITQPMLFPWPGFFEQLMLADHYIYLDDTQFSKGSFTNRVQVLQGDDRAWMTIPLAGNGTFQQIADLQASDKQDWKTRHRDLLKQSLRGAPYLDDALRVFDQVYAHTNLLDLLIASIEEPARYLGVGVGRTIQKTSAMDVGGTSWQRVLDIVLRAGGDHYLTGHGAANYLDHDAFARSGVHVQYMNYSRTPWPQPGGRFTPYVSVLDLIARMGPESRACLIPSTTAWQEFLKETGAAQQAST